MPERRSPTTAKVAEMIATAGGGEMQSGQSTGAKATIVQVNFSPAFSGIPRVSLTPHSNHSVWITEVTVNYFKWNNNSKNVDVTMDWIAMNL